MKEINLSLKIEDVNLLLTALGNLPFIQVHELITKIQSQATPQLNDNANPNSQTKAINVENNQN
ncbi:MAG: hypothetical protein ACTHK0_05710 [Ginsengibacter sp.]